MFIKFKNIKGYNLSQKTYNILSENKNLSSTIWKDSSLNADIKKNDYEEHIFHESNFSVQDLEDLKNPEKAEAVHQKNIKIIEHNLKVFHRYDVKFPNTKYEIIIVFNGEGYDSFVYDKTKLSANKEIKSNTDELVNKFVEGDLSVIENIENPIEFLFDYKKHTGGKTLYSHLLSLYENKQISSEKIIEYLIELGIKFDDYENKLSNTNLSNVNSYSDFAMDLKRFFSSSEYIKSKYESHSNYKEYVKLIQDFVQKKFNVELSEYGAFWIINNLGTNPQLSYGLFDENLSLIGFNIEKLKSDCDNNTFTDGFYDNFTSYLHDVIINGENDTLESLNNIAEALENEYGRYNFNIQESKINSLVKLSDKMIKDGEKTLDITKKEDKIVIKNKLTNQERIIDLGFVTAGLPIEYKNCLIDSLNGFNNISLWEFAVEIVQPIGFDPKLEWHNAIAAYFSESDTIDVTKNLTSKDLLHEMMHALMCTYIDGENAHNEPLYSEFIEAFNEESYEYKRKRIRRVSGGNYTYCAKNIYEFAAEAGCLWLSGKSDSEYTIATHFPKSYRLIVQLIEKIRSQETGRSDPYYAFKIR